MPLETMMNPDDNPANSQDDDLLPEYDARLLKNGVRGKYAGRITRPFLQPDCFLCLLGNAERKR